jgi:hypothetical protein
MRTTRGHVVITPGQKKPYKTVLEHEDGEITEHPVDTIREGEDLIRHRVLPPPPALLERLRRNPREA